MIYQELLGTTVAAVLQKKHLSIKAIIVIVASTRGRTHHHRLASSGQSPAKLAATTHEDKAETETRIASKAMIDIRRDAPADHRFGPRSRRSTRLAGSHGGDHSVRTVITLIKGNNNYPFALGHRWTGFPAGEDPRGAGHIIRILVQLWQDFTRALYFRVNYLYLKDCSWF